MGLGNKGSKYIFNVLLPWQSFEQACYNTSMRLAFAEMLSQSHQTFLIPLVMQERAGRHSEGRYSPFQDIYITTTTLCYLDLLSTMKNQWPVLCLFSSCCCPTQLAVLQLFQIPSWVSKLLSRSSLSYEAVTIATTTKNPLHSSSTCLLNIYCVSATVQCSCETPGAHRQIPCPPGACILADAE